MTPTAWCHVGIRKPEPYPSLSSRAAWTKGEDGEAGPRAPHVSKATCDQIPPPSEDILIIHDDNNTKKTFQNTEGLF